MSASHSLGHLWSPPLPERKRQLLTLGFFLFKKNEFVGGFFCTWKRLFDFHFPLFPPCVIHLQNSVAVASIHLPLAGPPLSSPALQSVDNSTCRLQFIVFRNGKLFPCTGNSSNLADDGKRRSVSTPVAFTKLGKRKFIFFYLSGRGVSVACLHAYIRAHTRSQCATCCNGRSELCARCHNKLEVSRSVELHLIPLNEANLQRRRKFPLSASRSNSDTLSPVL